MYFFGIIIDAFIGVKEWGVARLFPALSTVASSWEILSLISILYGTAFCFAGGGCLYGLILLGFVVFLFVLVCCLCHGLIVGCCFGGCHGFLDGYEDVGITAGVVAV
jgi:hypothetical protein